MKIEDYADAMEIQDILLKTSMDHTEVQRLIDILLNHQDEIAFLGLLGELNPAAFDAYIQRIFGV